MPKARLWTGLFYWIKRPTLLAQMPLMSYPPLELPAHVHNRNDGPLCNCHGHPMSWSNDSRRRSGGNWRCRIRQAEFQSKKYWDSESGYRERRLENERERYFLRDWKKKRLRDLARQRQKVLDELEGLGA